MLDGKKAKDPKKKQFTWAGFCSNFRVIWQCLWPRGKPVLQLRFFASLLLIVVNRGLNVFIPILYKQIGKTLGLVSLLLVAYWLIHWTFYE